MRAVSDRVQRIRRGIRVNGLIPYCERFVTTTFNRTFRARLCVWVWKPDDPLPDVAEDVHVERLTREDELADRDVEQLVVGDGPGFVARMQEEFCEGGVLWLARVDGDVAGYQWSRTGDRVENWHFDLTGEDALIYSTVTFPEFRGRGIASRIVAQICRDEVGAGGRAVADCMVWNKPAVRLFERSGFTKFAERKPLPDHPD